MTTVEKLQALEAARGAYLERLAKSQSLNGDARAVELAKLRDMAREANLLWGDFSSEMGLGLPIDTESLDLIEITPEENL